MPWHRPCCVWATCCVNLSCMSDTVTGEYGPNLARYIDRLRGETSVREFARTHGLDFQAISRWKNGESPSLSLLRQVADGLEVTLGQVLLEAGWGTAEDFTVVERVEEPSIELADAIAAADLDAEEQTSLLHLLSLYEDRRKGRTTPKAKRKVTFRLPPKH